MLRLSALLPLLALIPVAAHGELMVKRFEEPILQQMDPRVTAKNPTSAETGPSLLAKGTRPSDQVWFIPFFKVDTSGALANTTLYSIRNEMAAGMATVTVAYFNAMFGNPVSQNFALIPNQLASFNLRDVAGLDVDIDGFSRGLIRVTPGLDEAISVDFFQVDAENDFATGSHGFIFPDDFCTNWMIRFLSFGGLSGGSAMGFLVNGPRGADPGDPASVFGNVYDEAGTFINSFTIHTDEWSFERDVLDFVEAGTSFGSIELTLNVLTPPGGLLTVGHSAFGKFSVGVQGVCQDQP